MTNKLQSARGRSATPASRVALLLCSGLLLVTLCAGCRSAGDVSVAFRPMYGVDMFPVPAGSRVIGPDGKPVCWTDEQGKVVPRFRATRDLSRDEVIAALEAGQILRNHSEDWYSNCRSGAVVERRLAEKRAQQRPIEMVECDCGHTVARHVVMRASLGTACPDCYDDMS